MKFFYRVMSVVFFVGTIQTYGMQQALCSFSENDLYKMSVASTDVVLGVKKIITMPIMLINPDKSITRLKNKLIDIEHSIRTDYDNQIRCITKEYNVDDAGTQIIFKILDAIKSEYRKSHQIGVKNVVHNEKIPFKNFTLLKVLLCKKNIDINNISLINSREQLGEHDAQARFEYTYRYAEQDNGDIGAVYFNNEPISIIFFPTFYNLDQMEQAGLCIHEATHVVEGHAVSRSMLLDVMEKFTQENVRESKSYKKLEQITERQAEVLPALEDSHVAALMRIMRFKGYYPGMLEGDHYKQLSEIDNTHRMIASLEYVKDHMHKIMPWVVAVPFLAACFWGGK
jgi:hypothetical protein